MSYSISTLLTRNLHEVFGDNDAARRRAAIDEILTEDWVFYDSIGRRLADQNSSELNDNRPSARHFVNVDMSDVINSVTLFSLSNLPLAVRLLFNYCFNKTMEAT